MPPDPSDFTVAESKDGKTKIHWFPSRVWS
jgi:hypothetical protein